MVLRVCDGVRLGEPCRTLFAVGVFSCPHCGSTEHHEFGSRPEDEKDPQMAKLRVHGGPSNGPGESLTADGSGVDGGEGPAAPAEETLGALVDPARPAVNAPKREWVAYAAKVFGTDPDALDEGYSKRQLIALVGEQDAGTPSEQEPGDEDSNGDTVEPEGDDSDDTVDDSDE